MKKKNWWFGQVDAYWRWSLTRGGRTWRFDCMLPLSVPCHACVTHIENTLITNTNNKNKNKHLVWSRLFWFSWCNSRHSIDSRTDDRHIKQVHCTTSARSILRRRIMHLIICTRSIVNEQGFVTIRLLSMDLSITFYRLETDKILSLHWLVEIHLNVKQVYEVMRNNYFWLVRFILSNFTIMYAVTDFGI